MNYFNRYLTVDCKTLVESYRQQAFNQPDKEAYKYIHYLKNGKIEEISITYYELDKRARIIASYLQEHNGRGKRVILAYPSGIEYIEAYLGCLYAGAIAVPAYPPNSSRLFLPRLHNMITDSQAEFVFTTSPIQASIASNFPEFFTLYNLQWLETDCLIEDTSCLWKETGITSDSIAFLQYTSGSTSTPKGVMVTHNNLMHNISLIGKSFGALLEEVDSNLNAVTWLPPYHDMGLIGGILALLFFGITINNMSPYAFILKPYRWLQAMTRYESDISAAPNFAFDLCVKTIKPVEIEKLDLSNWRIAFNGAEPINPKTIDNFTSTFSQCGFRKEVFYPCYGLAESSLIVTGGIMGRLPVIKAFNKNELENHIVQEVNKDDKNARLLVGCGQTLDGGQIVIVDLETMLPCKLNEVGEIWIKSPSVARGYWNRKDQTRETFKAILMNDEENQFLRTGDIGFFHDNELFISGRLKDLIIVKGRNINPNDIERAVEDVHQALRKNSNAAFSINVDGEEKIVLLQEIEKSYPNDFDKYAVISLIRDVVSTEFDLELYDVVLVKRGIIKKTTSGKIRRKACRDDYLATS